MCVGGGLGRVGKGFGFFGGRFIFSNRPEDTVLNVFVFRGNYGYNN